MIKFKTSTKYKLYYALALFIVYITYLFLYFLSNKNYNELFAHAVTWGVPTLFIYYIFIYRMVIIVKDKKYLIYKPSNAILKKELDIQKIDKIVPKKNRLGTVLLYYQNRVIKLYPQDSDEFVRLINEYKADKS